MKIDNIWSFMENLVSKPIELIDGNAIFPYPSVGAEDLVLYVKNPGFKHITYYVNIAGGLVVMGIDERKILKDIEFNISRSTWKEDNELKTPSKLCTWDSSSRRSFISVAIGAYAGIKYAEWE